MEDDAIVELFFARSERALAELEKKYGPLCESIAVHLLGDRRDAEECVNDALLAVWNTVPPQRPDPLSSYVCRIVRNLALGKYRRNTALKRNSAWDAALDELADCFPSADTAESAAEAGEVAGMVNRWLASLDRDSRVLFVRRYWFADPVKEIAVASHSSEPRVSSRLFRLRGKLRNYLKKEGLLV